MRREIKVAAGAGALLVLLFSIGPAQALSGSNTVASDDIIDGQVKTTDLGVEAVTATRVKDNSLTGADINEATLHPRVEFMLVNKDGTKVSGTGTSVRSGAGAYEITFPRSVANCAATVNTGNIPNSSGSGVRIPMVNSFGDKTLQVLLYPQDSGGLLADSSFRMTLICP
jgi:hypothetical protein